jgi:ferric-dicitrate binding protein FerR (iron transport regulator)
VNYLYYSAEDLALDPSFRQWVLHPEAPDGAAFWEAWLARNPGKAAEVAAARRLVEASQAEREELPGEEKQLLWERIQATLAADEEVPPPVRPYWFWWFAAAMALLLVAGGLGWHWYATQRVYLTTGFGQTRQLVLPDHSVVTLNGNSSLSYRRTWPVDQAREVWLEGEAFFNVTGQPTGPNARFLVHAEELTVAVLGTQFNVSRRGTGARVVLTAGKVELDIAGALTRLQMQPGEVVELAARSGKVTRRVADPALYTSWKNHELLFDETPLAQIARMLEDTYGKKVVFRQPALANYRISGTIPSDNVDILLRALARSSNFEIMQQNDTILFHSQAFRP